MSLGECLTEKSGRINLGLEGTLVFGAMAGYAIAYETGSAWIGVLAAGLSGCVFGAIHGYICKLPKVNDIAIGIALMLFGTGLAFFLGKAYIQPQAPRLPTISLAGWTGNPQVEQAFQVNPLFLVGIVLAVRDVVGVQEHPLRADRADDRGFCRGRQGDGLLGRLGALHLDHASAASSPASVARSCRSTIPAAGARACPPARA